MKSNFKDVRDLERQYSRYEKRFNSIEKSLATILEKLNLREKGTMLSQEVNTPNVTINAVVYEYLKYYERERKECVTPHFDV